MTYWRNVTNLSQNGEKTPVPAAWMEYTDLARKVYQRPSGDHSGHKKSRELARLSIALMV
jgi:hypothetical protein